jgi:phospholipase C
MQSRRDFLKLAAAVSGGAGLSGLVPDAIQRAYAIDPAPGSTYRDAEHVVILMQENRSFDHAFGTLRGVRGFNDPRALRLANGNSVFVQTDAAGHSYAPWRLDMRDTRATWMGDLPHSRDSQIDAWHEGRHDGWLEAKRSENKEYSDLPLTMGHYTREDIPFYYALADAFTVCDQHYCSVMTSTSPNRCFLWSGTIRDQQSVDSRVFMRNEQIDPGGMTWKTFPERLQEAGVTWKSYQNELTRCGLGGEDEAWLSNFGDNALEWFAAYNVEAYAGYPAAAQRFFSQLSTQAAQLEKEIATGGDAKVQTQRRADLADAKKQMEAIQSSLKQSGEVRYQRLSAQEKALHDAAFVTNTGDPHYHALDSLSFEDEGKTHTMRAPKGDILHQFRKDVEAGQLPTVSWLSAPEKFSDHPTSPWYGAWYVSEVMDILTKNPEVWKKTIFILTYDENDGYFDHAPSFVAADPKRPETGGASAGIETGLEYSYREDELRQGVTAQEARSGPMGLGFRVPLLIASPWTRGGWVNSQVCDHTSTLMFVEDFVAHKYGKTVREENISTWRRTVCGNLTSMFRPYDPKAANLAFLNRDKFVIGIEKARYKELPSQFTRLTAEQINEMNRTPLQPGRQESGVRPACALPYELSADARLSEDGKHYEIHLGAGKAAGAPFNIYLRNTKNAALLAATYAVKPRDTLMKQFPLTLFGDGGHSLEVHGPNGFYRSFTGGLSPVEVRTVYEREGEQLTGNLQVHLQSKSTVPVTVTITDNGYRAKPITKTIPHGTETAVVLPLGGSRGWYDFSVQAQATPGESRYAGHVETGQASTSDPLMGGEA